MLVYSRNPLLSLRNCWKASNLAQGYGSVMHPIQEETGKRSHSITFWLPEEGSEVGIKKIIQLPGYLDDQR